MIKLDNGTDQLRIFPKKYVSNLQLKNRVAYENKSKCWENKHVCTDG